MNIFQSDLNLFRISPEIDLEVDDKTLANQLCEFYRGTLDMPVQDAYLFFYHREMTYQVLFPAGLIIENLKHWISIDELTAAFQETLEGGIRKPNNQSTTLRKNIESFVQDLSRRNLLEIKNIDPQTTVT